MTLKQMKSGCGAGGSALPWGGRGRKFKSCHSDQIRRNRMTPTDFFMPKNKIRLSIRIPFLAFLTIKKEPNPRGYTFLAGAGHGRCERAKRTRRYLLGHRRSAPQGRTKRSCCVCQRSYYQKKRADNPYSSIGYGLSALRLSVWLFRYGDCKALCINDTLRRYLCLER